MQHKEGTSGAHCSAHVPSSPKKQNPKQNTIPQGGTISVFCHLYEATYSLRGGIGFRTVINGSPFLKVSVYKKLDCKLMSFLRLPLLSKLIFPLSLSAAERPELDGALAERQLSSRLREQTLHFYPYLCANTHTQTDRQANTCVGKHYSKGER